jgi:hypothetical protein
MVFGFGKQNVTPVYNTGYSSYYQTTPQTMIPTQHMTLRQKFAAKRALRKQVVYPGYYTTQTSVVKPSLYQRAKFSICKHRTNNSN